jgi:hypothetical protein
MTRSLLVYDGSSRWFRAAAEAVTCRTDLVPVPWESDAVGAFLEAQFGGRPFAFLLVEGDAVHVGRETVERVLRRRGVPATVAGALGGAYPRIAGPFGRAVHGRTPAELEGTFPLDPEARSHLEPLRSGYEVPVEEA